MWKRSDSRAFRARPADRVARNGANVAAQQRQPVGAGDPRSFPAGGSPIARWMVWMVSVYVYVMENPGIYVMYDDWG